VPNEENMKLLKEAGIEVNVWTIDDPALASRLIDLGVDYITTNILE
jgi:glycerophosphoryl diester phosphodiesterase